MSAVVRIAVVADALKARQELESTGKAADRMGTQTTNAAGKAGGVLARFGRDARRSGQDAGAGFDSAAEGADKAEQRAMGFRDTLTGVQDSMSGAAMIAKGDLFNGFLTLGAGVGDLASGFANLLIPLTQTGLAQIKNTVATVASTTASVAASAATKASAAAQWALNAALSANPIGLVVIAVAALVAGLIIAYKKFETFRNIVNAAFGAVGKVVGSVVTFIKNNWRTLLVILTGPIGIAVALVTKNFDRIRGAAGAVVSWVKNNWRLLLGIITGPIGAAVATVTKNFEAIKDTVGKVKGWITGAFTGAKDWLKDAGRRIIDGFVDALSAGFRRVKDTLSGLTKLLPDWKGPAARDAALLAPAGRTIMAGFQRALESRYSAIRASLRTLTADLARSANDAALAPISPIGSRTTGGTFTVRNSTALAPNARELIEAMREYVRINGPIRGVSFA